MTITESDSTEGGIESPPVSLADFLLARIAEDEAWLDCGVSSHDGSSGFTPATCECDFRDKRESLAKRQIVGMGPSKCSQWGEDQDPELVAWFAEADMVPTPHYPDEGWSHCDGCAAAESCDHAWTHTLRALAAVYADRPGYRQEWKP